MLTMRVLIDAASILFAVAIRPVHSLPVQFLPPGDHQVASRVVHEIRGGNNAIKLNDAPEREVFEPTKTTSEEIKPLQKAIETVLSNLKNINTESIQKQMEMIKAKSKQLSEHLSKVSSALGPATVAFLEDFHSKDGMLLTLPAMYALTLLGSSCGFYLFSYFITVGFAFGVMVPMLASLCLYNVSVRAR